VAAARSILRFCRQPGAIAALVEGPVTMHQSLPLRQPAVRGLAERAEVRLDLRHCAYLDSTFRGILHFFARCLARTEHAMQWRAMLVPRQPASIGPPHGDAENGLFRPVDELSGVVAGPATSSDFYRSPGGASAARFRNHPWQAEVELDHRISAAITMSIPRPIPSERARSSPSGSAEHNRATSQRGRANRAAATG
jgi:hypothetical protein